MDKVLVHRGLTTLDVLVIGLVVVVDLVRHVGNDLEMGQHRYRGFHSRACGRQGLAHIVRHGQTS